MGEYYSNGGHGDVEHAGTTDKLWFSQADLVKSETLGAFDKDRFARLYYRHKIAELLFPGHIIQVVGASSTHSEESDHLRGPKYVHKLWSRRADVPDGHVSYSSHMDKSNNRLKRCTCPDCERHYTQFHTKSLKQKARRLSMRAEEVGITLLAWDETDYCLGPNGILFFEVDGIDVYTLWTYLTRTSREPSVTRLCLNYLDRYQKSIMRSKHHSILHKIRHVE